MFTPEELRQIWTAMTQYVDNNDPDRAEGVEPEDAERLGYRSDAAFAALEKLDALFAKG